MENLIKLRKERQISTREMADKLNISKSTYNHWETGRCEPDIEHLKALAGFFCVSIDYLVGSTIREVKNISPAPNSDNLSPDERKLLKAFNSLDVFERDFFLSQITARAERKDVIKK